MRRVRGPLGLLAGVGIALVGGAVLSELGVPGGVSVILWVNVVAITLELAFFQYGTRGARVPNRVPLSSVVVPMVAFTAADERVVAVVYAVQVGGASRSH